MAMGAAKEGFTHPLLSSSFPRFFGKIWLLPLFKLATIGSQRFILEQQQPTNSQNCRYENECEDPFLIYSVLSGAQRQVVAELHC